MARRTKADTDSGSGYAVVSLKRLSSPGDFFVEMTTPHGKYTDGPTSRREVETKVDAYAGRPESHMRDAFRLNRAILNEFPERDASMSELAEFAERVGFDLPESALDPSRAWEAIFGETNVVDAKSVGGETVVAPATGDEDAADVVAVSDGKGDSGEGAGNA